jgi:signal transduction histidine kinase
MPRRKQHELTTQDSSAPGCKRGIWAIFPSAEDLPADTKDRMLGSNRLALPPLPGSDHVEVGILRIAAILSSLATLLVGVAAVIGDVDAALVTGPAVLAGVAVILLRLRPSAFVFAMTASAVAVLQVWYAGPGLSDTAGVGALLVLGVTGALFLRSRVVAYLTGFSLLIVAAEVVWHGGEVAATGVLLHSGIPTLIFAFTGWLAVALRQRLHAAEVRYRNMFDRAPVGIWREDFTSVSRWLDELRAGGVTDLRDHLAEHPEDTRTAAALIRIVDVNQAAVDFLEADGRDQLIGGLPVASMTDETTLAIVDQLDAIWHGRSFAEAEVQGLTLKGNRIDAVLRWSAPIVGDALDLADVVVTTSNISRQKEAERRLGEQLRSKDEFVAAVSHELRTPLTAVAGLSQELRDRFNEFSEMESHEIIELIAAQSVDMANIVEDLLVAARAEVGSLQLDVAAVDVRAELTRVFGERGGTMAIGVEADGACPPALGDPARIRQILRNLIVNADRYGGPATRVRIVHGGSMVRVEVRDDGPPIAPADRDRIFDPYQRAGMVPGMTSSVGLGLTLSRRLAWLMMGDVTYDHDGSESIFTLSIPVVPTTGNRPSTPPPGLRRHTSKGEPAPIPVIPRSG